MCRSWSFTSFILLDFSSRDLQLQIELRKCCLLKNKTTKQSYIMTFCWCQVPQAPATQLLGLEDGSKMNLFHFCADSCEGNVEPPWISRSTSSKRAPLAFRHDEAKKGCLEIDYVWWVVHMHICMCICVYIYIHLRWHINSFRGVVLSGIGTEFIGSPLHS